MDNLCCLKCGHNWTPRIKNKPRSCPNCKSRTWDRKRYFKCEVCKRNFLLIHQHHKDGNKKNNKKNNLIYICVDCHSVIHSGISKKKGKRMRKYKNSPEILKKLNELNIKLLEGKERWD